MTTPRPCAAQMRLLRGLLDGEWHRDAEIDHGPDRQYTGACEDAGWIEGRWVPAWQMPGGFAEWRLTDAGRAAIAAAEEAGT